MTKVHYLPTSNIFLPAQPDWTLEGVSLPCDDVAHWVVDQQPFRWINGLWEAETLIERPSRSVRPPHLVFIRIAPDTLRRWKDLAIDPLIEACEQLKDHLRNGVPAEDRSVLILL